MFKVTCRSRGGGYNVVRPLVGRDGGGGLRGGVGDDLVTADHAGEPQSDTAAHLVPPLLAPATASRALGPLRPHEVVGQRAGVLVTGRVLAQQPSVIQSVCQSVSLSVSLLYSPSSLLSESHRPVRGGHTGGLLPGVRGWCRTCTWSPPPRHTSPGSAGPSGRHSNSGLWTRETTDRPL